MLVCDRIHLSCRLSGTYPRCWDMADRDSPLLTWAMSVDLQWRRALLEDLWTRDDCAVRLPP